MLPRPLALLVIFVVSLVVAASAHAQTPDPDRAVDPGEPDFTLASLPTTLRMPRNTFGFRLTHRFTRPIDEGTVGDFFRDLFGFDSSARIGLELRYGLMAGTQVAIFRTNDRAIQLSGQHTILKQNEKRWLSIDAFGAADGADNFTEDYSGTIGAAVSHVFTGRAAVYGHVFYVSNVLTGGDPESGPDWTTCVGIGARFRFTKTSKVYLVFEAAPQVAGLKDGADHVSVGIERRAGAHMFQFTVANNLGTSYRQVARGGVNPGDWYVGFNLTRRFY